MPRGLDAFYRGRFKNGLWLTTAGDQRPGFASVPGPDRREKPVGLVTVRPKAQVIFRVLAAAAQRIGILNLQIGQHFGRGKWAELPIGLAERLRDRLVFGWQEAA